MSSQTPISHSTPLSLLILLLLLVPPLPIHSSNSSNNITDLLSPYPNFSDFTSLLTSTAVAAALPSPATILAVPNSLLRRSSPSSSSLPDALRFHILLAFLSLPDLRLIPPSGRLVPTLSPSSPLNVTFDPSSGAVTFRSPSSNATLIAVVNTLRDNNISILSVNSLLLPTSLDLTASETRPPLGLNITKALIDGHSFNVAAAMLAASGVVSEFEADEAGAGITLFVPTDEAFADLPASVRFQSLPADRKAVVLRFHVLHSYYPLGSLESIVNPIYPTLATEQNGAGSFTVNISRVNGSVGIDTGVVQASVTQTVFDQNPVAIFGVSKVLLPKEYFGKNPIEADKPSGGGMMASAQPPEMALPPGNSPYGPPSHLSAPPGLEVRAAAAGVSGSSIGMLCIALYCYLLLL